MNVSFFFEMAWKSGLIAGLALLLALLLRSRAAADRTALFRIALCLLLALPAISLMLPSIPLEIAAAAREVPPLLLPAATPGDVAALADGATLSVAEPTIWDDPSELVLLLYIGGLLMVGGRLAVGLFTLNLWTRRADPVLSSEWTEALDRAVADVDGAAANVRLLVSTEADSPLSWGWRRPVILLDTDSCQLTEEADAILAHEMAHVSRGDWMTLVIARLAVALFWFNPLVWLIERAVMEDAEEAADCHALKRIEPTRYAQILVHFARLERGALLPANSIASGGLSRRVDAILSGDLVGVRTGSARSLAAMAASVAIATPVAALQLTAPAPQIAESPLMQLAATTAEPEFEPVDVDVPDATARWDEAPVPPAPPLADLPDAPDAPDVPPVPAAPSPVAFASAIPAPPRAPAPPSAPPAPRAMATAYVTVSARANPVVVQVHDERWERDYERAMERANKEMERAAEQAGREAERAVAAAQREIQRAHITASRNFALSMEQGARGMERGADGMERGAQKMWDEAQNLRNRDYRERRIAEAAARGKRLTHQQLIDMIDGLEDGSRDMREGAADMRREAAEMRRERFEDES